MYAKERIVIRQIGKTPVVGICKDNILASNTLYSVYPNGDEYNILFLLACLSSTFIKEYWLAKYSDNKALFPKIKGFQIKDLPIPIASLDQQKPIIDLVSLLLSDSASDNDEVIRQIDDLVCDLYTCQE